MCPVPVMVDHIVTAHFEAVKQVKDAPQPSTERVEHPRSFLAWTKSGSHQRASGNAFVTVRLPVWMLCFGSGAEDGIEVDTMLMNRECSCIACPCKVL